MWGMGWKGRRWEIRLWWEGYVFKDLIKCFLLLRGWCQHQTLFWTFCSISFPQVYSHIQLQFKSHHYYLDSVLSTPSSTTQFLGIFEAKTHQIKQYIICYSCWKYVFLRLDFPLSCSMCEFLLLNSCACLFVSNPFLEIYKDNKDTYNKWI